LAFLDYGGGFQGFHFLFNIIGADLQLDWGLCRKCARSQKASHGGGFFFLVGAAKHMPEFQGIYEARALHEVNKRLTSRGARASEQWDDYDTDTPVYKTRLQIGFMGFFLEQKGYGNWHERTYSHCDIISPTTE